MSDTQPRLSKKELDKPGSYIYGDIEYKTLRSAILAAWNAGDTHRIPYILDRERNRKIKINKEIWKI